MTGLNLSIPMPQLILAVSAIGLALLLGRHKMGLLIGYFACLYWGYVANTGAIIDAMGGNAVGQLLFILFGFFLAFLGLAFVFTPSNR